MSACNTSTNLLQHDSKTNQTNTSSYSAPCTERIVYRTHTALFDNTEMIPGGKTPEDVETVQIT